MRRWNRGSDQLNRVLAVEGKRGAQYFMPAHNLVESPLEYFEIKWAVEPPTESSVVAWIPGLRPVGKPHPLLCRRKRECKQFVTPTCRFSRLSRSVLFQRLFWICWLGEIRHRLLPVIGGPHASRGICPATRE